MSKLVPVIGVLGSLPFVCAYGKVLTFTDLSREQSVRWARHDVIGKKPVLEWVGDDLARVSLKIRFDTNLSVPPMLGLKMLNSMLEDKKAKTLVIGGEYFGRFVIDSVGEDRKYFTGAGVCIVAEATVSLIECPEEGPSAVSKLLSKVSDSVKGVFS